MSEKKVKHVYLVEVKGAGKDAQWCIIGVAASKKAAKDLAVGTGDPFDYDWENAPGCAIGKSKRSGFVYILTRHAVHRVGGEL